MINDSIDNITRLLEDLKKELLEDTDIRDDHRKLIKEEIQMLEKEIAGAL